MSLWENPAVVAGAITVGIFFVYAVTRCSVVFVKDCFSVLWCNGVLRERPPPRCEDTEAPETPDMSRLIPGNDQAK